MNYTKSSFSLKSLASAVLDLVLPPRCPQTGEIVPLVGTLSPSAWANLQFISAPYCSCCGIPFPVIDTMEQNQDTLLCAGCIATPRPYQKARAALAYNDSSRSLLLGFKHGDKTHLTVTFAPLLKLYGGDVLENADALVPVPLHWRRLLSRRYNQSAILAHSLSKITNIPTWADALLRKRHTPPQGHKNARDRHANVKGVFGLSPKYAEKIQGKNIVLIDDVLTTGATIESCADALIKGGASSVNILTLARVVRDE